MSGRDAASTDTSTLFGFGLEVKMVVMAAARVKSAAAMRTLITAFEVMVDAEFCLAGAAQDGLLLPLASGPALRRMRGRFFMTTETGIIPVAAAEADRDDIKHGLVMGTTRFAVYHGSVNMRSGHTAR